MDPRVLEEKIRKAREVGVDADGRKFTIRRPTDEEMAIAVANGDGLLPIVKRFVIGWDLVEIDLIPGGSPEKVPFDSELFAEWVADQPSVWTPLGNAVIAAYKAHADKRDAAVKN